MLREKKLGILSQSRHTDQMLNYTAHDTVEVSITPRLPSGHPNDLITVPLSFSELFEIYKWLVTTFILIAH